MPTTEETAAAVANAKATLADAESAHAEATAIAAANLTPQEIIAQILGEITMLLGNRPTLEALVAQFLKAAGITLPAPPA